MAEKKQVVESSTTKALKTRLEILKSILHNDEMLETHLAINYANEASSIQKAIETIEGL